MGIFNKKRTLAEILKDIAALTDEERTKLIKSMSAETEEGVDEEVPEEATDKETEEGEESEVETEEPEQDAEAEEDEGSESTPSEEEAEEDNPPAEETEEETPEVEATEEPEKEGDNSGTPLAEMIKEVVREEVKKALEAFSKPPVEDTNPTPASNTQQDKYNRLMARYNTD